MRLVDGDCAALPVAGGFDEGFGEAAFIEQMAAKELGGL
jgi:hypothetical protein